ncbi:MAG: EF-P beta-lysylation protein EpmB [Gammaproteobacteria bacterium]|jgi:EF-P beta-lysylation protein EpmB
MIPLTRPSGQPAEWQRLLADAISDPAELLQLLDLEPSLLPAARQAASLFPLRVPRGFVARMRRGDPDDPLLRQVLPLGDELALTPGYWRDPVGDMASRVGNGLLQKYHGRVLLVTTGACAVHCRYCFRRHFPYAEENPRRGGWRDAVDAISADPSINEVILSGGDPLSLTDHRLAELVAMLEAVPHLQTLRLHTRVPIVLPERVDNSLVGWLSRTRLRKVVVLHANHPDEIDESVARGFARLREAGATLFNQAVLLAGVNDDVATLEHLGERLFATGVIPYYLHLLDPVEGAAHFDVPEHRARRVVEELRARLPGYLVPKLVREIAGEPSKTPII